MRFKYSRQDGIKDCGVCVLHNIIKYYGGNIDFEKLRNMTNTNKEGTSIYDIVVTARKLGLKSHSYKCEINDLCNINFPIVAHLNVEKKYSHFVIIKKIVDYEIYIFDPIRGNIKYDIEVFNEEWSNVIITFEKTDKLINEENSYKSFLKLKIKENKIFLMLISLLSILCTFISSLNSFYIQEIIDNINNSEKILLTFLCLSISYIIIYYIKNIVIIKFNTRFDSKLTEYIYSHILSLPIKYHLVRPAGDTVSRIYDLYYVKDFINELSYSIIVDIILVIIINTFLFLINKILFLLSLLVTIIFICVYFIYRDKINSLVLTNQENQSQVNSTLVENLLGINTIKNLKLENKILIKQKQIYNSYLKKNQELSMTYNSYQTKEEIIGLVGNITVLFVGSIFVQNKILSVGSLVASNTLIVNLFSTIKKLINDDNLIINSKNAYKRINELLAVKEEEKNENNLTFNNCIEIRDLSFSYNNLPIINHFNLTINKNDCILVTGKSGIGKSTIFKILTKQLSCLSNMILLDGISIDNYSNDYIKSKICYVSQNEFIFTDTIKNNIKLFNNDISENEFNKVLEITMVDKILKNKNISINYLLEENGHNLSGGERQKILIARSLLSRRNLIIFDETMNEIDIESEREIIKNIKAEYDKTLIFISHRLSNQDLFNKCVVL